MIGILIMCSFLLGLICLCLIINRLINNLRKKSKKLNDPKETIIRKHMKLVEKLKVANPTESQNKLTKVYLIHFFYIL